MDTITLAPTVEESRTMEPLPVTVTEQEHPLKQELRMFTGTMEWHKWSHLFRNFLLTDGAQYLAEEAGAYWLMDLIASHFTKRKVRSEPFQVWQLKLLPEEAVNMAKVWAEDGNGNHVSQQLIPYTDFPLDDIKLFVSWSDGYWVIMLPSEY